MKKLSVVLCLLFMVCVSYGQACGVYKLRYTGSIHSDSLKILRLKLPNTSYLQGSTDTEDYIDAKLISEKFELQLTSRLGSVPQNKESLLSLYKKNCPTFKLKLSVLGNKNDIVIEIDWKNIIITEIDEFEKTFELRFENISL